MSFRIRGAWLHPREGHPLDSSEGDSALLRMKAAGVTHVAIGWDVAMPVLKEPKLEFGHDDATLRSVLKRIRKAGLQAFLLPRIESPDFFKPPYPFRADIDFQDAAGWERFHSELERMTLHYGALAQAEGVAIYGISLELKRSARHHEKRWRELIAKARSVFRGMLTYSANWWDEWEQVPFWDALDAIGIGAYFEVPEKDPETGKVQPAAPDFPGIVAAWQPIVARLSAFAAKQKKPLLFTEIGYTGYRDCVERPWEWAGKQEKGVAIDHARQALAYRALFTVFGKREDLAGIFVWSFFTKNAWVEDWEYAIEGRAALAELRGAYGGK